MLPLALLVAAAHAVSPDAADSALNSADRSARVRLHAEIGSLAPLSHVIQFDKNGTEFDYVAEGGQDNLFLFARLSADLDLGPRHTVVLLYQPLNLESTVRLNDDLIVDEALFLAGTPMHLRYGFDFVRGSWLYDLQEDDDRELALGLSLPSTAWKSMAASSGPTATSARFRSSRSGPASPLPRTATGASRRTASTPR